MPADPELSRLFKALAELCDSLVTLVDTMSEALGEMIDEDKRKRGMK